MNYHFDILATTRKNILATLEDLTLEQLNHIPEGFGNNIIWNVGHIIITQQILHYQLSGLPCHSPAAWLAAYRKGSQANSSVSKKEVAQLKNYLWDTVELLYSDFADNIFEKYKTYPTSYNITIHNIEEAIVFNNVHEGLHYGSILALKKLV